MRIYAGTLLLSLVFAVGCAAPGHYQRYVASTPIAGNEVKCPLPALGINRAVDELLSSLRRAPVNGAARGVLKLNNYPVSVDMAVTADQKNPMYPFKVDTRWGFLFVNIRRHLHIGDAWFDAQTKDGHEAGPSTNWHVQYVFGGPIKDWRDARIIFSGSAPLIEYEAMETNRGSSGETQLTLRSRTNTQTLIFDNEGNLKASTLYTGTEHTYTIFHEDWRMVDGPSGTRMLPFVTGIIFPHEGSSWVLRYTMQDRHLF